MNKVLSAHLETGRISNLPTVWSNIFVTFCLTGAATGYSNLLLIALSGSLLYVGGCYLGDAKDVAFDAEHKPSRPIPAGIVKRNTIWALGWSMMLLGLLAFSYGSDPLQIAFTIAGLPLAFVIVCYALVHKSTPVLGLPLIGSCRAMLLFSSYAAFFYSIDQAQDFSRSTGMNFQPVVAASIAVALYTICFASVARLESSDRNIAAPLVLKCIMLALPLSAFFYRESATSHLTLFLVTYTLYTAWLTLAFKQINTNKGAYVSKCLAGFALLDMVLVSDTSLVHCLICLALFILALTLQKIAPAT